MSEPEFKLRTFVCKYCQHEVVRNPNIKDDGYEPNVCMQCYETTGMKARDALFKMHLARGLTELCRLLTERDR